MNFKFAWGYFFFLTLLLIVLLGCIGWHGNDTEYRYYTAVRMHACDLLKNGRSTLAEFDPEKCQVSRRDLRAFELIDVTCHATRSTGDQYKFVHGYGDGHLIFRYVYDKTYAFRHGGYCHG